MRRVFVAIIVSLGGAPAMAQDRMPPIAADKMTEAQKKASAEFAEGRVTIFRAAPRRPA